MVCSLLPQAPDSAAGTETRRAGVEGGGTVGVKAPAYEHTGRLSWWELWPMAGWGLFVLYVYLQGWMPLFLWSVYGHLAAAGGALLLGLFVVGWVMRRRSLKREYAAARAARLRGEEPPTASIEAERYDPGHACEPGSGRVWLIVRSLAFIVPILVGVSLPVKGLNDLAAVQRGAEDWAMVAELASQRALEQAEFQRGYAWTSVLGMAQRLRADEPRKVGAMGFVLRTERTPPGRFLLVRFVITCCAADASPIAVPVRWEGAEDLETNQWVKVFGRTDPEAKVLVAEQVEEVQEPDNPYL